MSFCMKAKWFFNFLLRIDWIEIGSVTKCDNLNVSRQFVSLHTKMLFIKLHIFAKAFALPTHTAIIPMWHCSFQIARCCISSLNQCNRMDIKFYWYAHHKINLTFDRIKMHLCNVYNRTIKETKCVIDCTRWDGGFYGNCMHLHFIWWKNNHTLRFGASEANKIRPKQIHYIHSLGI